MNAAPRWRVLWAMWGLWPCLASAASIYGTNCRPAGPGGPRCRGDWSVAVRSYPAFAVSQFDLPGKTETYEIFRHPEGGRKDVFRWSAQGEKPDAELGIDLAGP